MPKYYEFKIAGYYLYFTSYCVIECMHVHASDRKLTEAGSAKFFVKSNGDTVLQNQGILSDRDVRKIQDFCQRKLSRNVPEMGRIQSAGFLWRSMKNTPPVLISMSAGGNDYYHFALLIFRHRASPSRLYAMRGQFLCCPRRCTAHRPRRLSPLPLCTLSAGCYWAFCSGAYICHSHWMLKIFIQI